VNLNAYEIGKYLVTVGEYARFVDEGGRQPDDWDSQLMYPNRPVVNVSWRDATAYCSWACVRLPTEAEWQRARGLSKRIHAWGDQEPDATRGNYRETNIGVPTPVGLSAWGDTGGNM
jgi:formylglycine-generating enzyme required for sulfatase activity